MSVNVDPNSMQYDLAEIRVDDTVVPCESFSIELSSTEEVRTVTNSHDPIGYKGGSREYSFSAESIDPSYHKKLMDIWVNRKTFNVSCYTFKENGKYYEELVLRGCRLTKINYETDDGFTPDIEGVALTLKV